MIGVINAKHSPKSGLQTTSNPNSKTTISFLVFCFERHLIAIRSQSIINSVVNALNVASEPTLDSNGL